MRRVLGRVIAGGVLAALSALIVTGDVQGQLTPSSLIPEGSTPLDLSGVVVDEITGQPLGGVRISIPGRAASTTTDQAGTYHLASFVMVLDRPGLVEAVLPGYFPEQRFAMLGCHMVVNPPGGEGRCRITLDFLMRAADLSPSRESTCSVGGTLFQTPSGRTAGGLVFLDGGQRFTSTRGTGKYLFENVQTGLHSFRAAGAGNEGRRLAWIACDSPGDVISLDFLLQTIVIQ